MKGLQEAGNELQRKKTSTIKIKSLSRRENISRNKYGYIGNVDFACRYVDEHGSKVR